MALLRTWALALAVSTAAAFRDTSPFFLLSTSPLRSTLSHQQLALSTSLHPQISKSLSSCPSDVYIVVNQPGVSAADYAGRRATPHLKRWLAGGDHRVASSATVSGVVGIIDADKISDDIQSRCRASVMRVDASTGQVPIAYGTPQVLRVDFSTLPASPQWKESTLADHDSFLHAVVSGMRDQSYTIIYTTSPPSTNSRLAHEPPPYEMDDPFGSVLHTDLKRDLSAHAANNTVDPDLPLFEKYQFLTPAIFMGLLAAFLLLMILYVGLTAISSLEVSYFAFSKEMGPAAQKKQQ